MGDTPGEQALFVVVQDPSQLLGLVGGKHGKAGGCLSWAMQVVERMRDILGLGIMQTHEGARFARGRKASLELEAGHSSQQQTGCARLVL